MNQNKLKPDHAKQHVETDVENIDFVDLFDINEMQKLQDAFSDAFEIASIITRPDGTPITRPSRFSRLCTEVIHNTESGRQTCRMLNPVGSIEELKQLTFRCEQCGKWEISAGMSVENHLVALWRVGQVRDPDTTDEQLLGYAVKIGADPEEYRTSLATIPVMSRQKLEKIAHLLTEAANLLTSKAFKNFQLKKTAYMHDNTDQIERANFMANQAFELAKAGYWSVPIDKSGYYISNPRTAKILGDLPKPDWRYHITDEWLANIEAADPEAAKKAFQSLNDLIEGRSKAYDVIYPYKRPVDGKVVWIRATANLTRNENQQPVEMHGVAQDITDQVLREKALKEAKERLDLALKGAWMGLWDWQPESGELVTSPIWAEMLGYSAEELDSLYPKNFERWQKLLHPEDLQRIWQDVQDHVDGTTSSYRAEFRLKTRSGKWKWILAVGKCVERNAEGKGTRMVGFHIDVDEQKQNEAALASAKTMAETATVAKSSFLANMSHEIRTPMNAIIGMSQLALQTDLTHQQRNYIEKVQLAAQNLLGIINDILDFSKIEAGKMAIDKTDFWLEDVLNNFAVLTSLKAEEKAIDLIFDIEPEMPLGLVGDPLRLNQILTNLGNNAIKFTDSGEVVIGVEQEKADEKSVELHFWIKDSGMGMDKSQQKRLFMPFCQVDNSATRKSGGTGLGLVISKSLIEDMKGKIWLDSEPGQGSTFHFTARFGIQFRQTLSQLSTKPLKGRRAFLLVKNMTERNILTHSIEHYGLVVESINSCPNIIGQLERLKTENREPELIVISSDTTGANSVECVLKIKNSAFAQIPVILITGAYQLERVLYSVDKLGIGPFRVLSRPVFPSALRTTMLEALGLVKTPDFVEQRIAGGTISLPKGPSGARILLVEDNEMNQELAIELLRQAGISVVLARHGQEALDILKHDQEFDGILMDCQMPVMDGYQTTIAIRSLPDLKEIPIIAMTANAMAGDREKALDVGMNDHIAKPIDVQVMFTTLARWIKSKSDAVTPAPEMATTPSGLAIPELAGINTGQILANLLNNTELYQKMLVNFYQSYSNFRETFMTSFKCDDPTAATRYAHSLKSCAGNIGAVSVKTLAERLERSCKSGIPLGALTELINETAAEINSVRNELEKVVAQPSKQTLEQRQPDYDKARFETVYRHLHTLLQESDSEAISLLDQNRQIMLAALGDKFDELTKLVRSYDFEAALSLIDKEQKQTS
ncbi:MAG: hypothetical protein A2W80_10890 [Candidatus Riflebacteria bacterium GWC2_50_8]|nr:MAG: hypothetical protein A2W80_10890 [Candidatus Riflebacteria bacterium GWC2_50_8]